MYVTIFIGVSNGCATARWLKGYGIIDMKRTEGPVDHEKFTMLCALAQADSLSAGEKLELEQHLKICGACREIYDQYSAIGKEGVAFLPEAYALTEEAQRWDNRKAWADISTAIRNQRTQQVLSFKTSRMRRGWSLMPSITGGRLAIASLAACAIIALTLSAYQMGERKNLVSPRQSANLVQREQNPVPERQESADFPAAQTEQISDLDKQISNERQEIAQLRAALIVANEKVNELGSGNGKREADLQQLAGERNQLAKRLSDSESAYQTMQADYSSLRADHDSYSLRTSSLESELTELRATNQDQERRLKDDAQYLTSDRDIRELMGARKLYIADVFDVDSNSHARKPFGRVFYTQSKSLVFYAFDLDHQPGVKNASVFQVWGQKDFQPNGQSHPMNLGILYMDSESNRRWVLRSDDPKQLAEIDAVFVTVEPHGGSQKPTGKPLLYALLRKEANHP
jgi:anti-sigma-K factor RskA